MVEAEFLARMPPKKGGKSASKKSSVPKPKKGGKVGKSKSKKVPAKKQANQVKSNNAKYRKLAAEILKIGT